MVTLKGTKLTREEFQGVLLAREELVKLYKEAIKDATFLHSKGNKAWKYVYSEGKRALKYYKQASDIIHSVTIVIAG